MIVISWSDGAVFAAKIASMHGWAPDFQERKQRMPGSFARLNDYCPATCLFTLGATFLQFDAGG